MLSRRFGEIMFGSKFKTIAHLRIIFRQIARMGNCLACLKIHGLARCAKFYFLRAKICFRIQIVA